MVRSEVAEVKLPVKSARLSFCSTCVAHDRKNINSQHQSPQQDFQIIIDVLCVFCFQFKPMKQEMIFFFCLEH